MEGNWIFCLTNVYIIAFDFFFLILSLFEAQNAMKVTYIWPYFVCPEPVLAFFCQQNMPPLSEASPSKMGFASRTCCSIQECWPLIAARNCRISFVLSVFPAPDSPLQRQQESRSVKALLHPCQCPSVSKGTALSVPILLAQVGRGR